MLNRKASEGAVPEIQLGRIAIMVDLKPARVLLASIEDRADHPHLSVSQCQRSIVCCTARGGAIEALIRKASRKNS
jgi:hypothetical protein